VEHNPTVGLDLSSCYGIEESSIQQILLHNFTVEYSEYCPGSIDAHEDVDSQKEQKPSIVLFSHCLVDPATEMIKPRL
jgi:hypothetical protein